MATEQPSREMEGGKAEGGRSPERARETAGDTSLRAGGEGKIWSLVFIFGVCTFVQKLKMTPEKYNSRLGKGISM